MCIFQLCHTVLPGGIATQALSACCYLSVASSSRRMTREKAASSKQRRQKAGNLHRDGSAMWQLFLAGCDYDVSRFVTMRITGSESGCSVRCWALTFWVKVSARQKGSSSWYINDRRNVGGVCSTIPSLLFPHFISVDSDPLAGQRVWHGSQIYVHW